MDPNACWARIEDAILDRNGADLGDACADLLHWIGEKSGFLPEALTSRGFNAQSARFFLQTVRHVVAAGLS